MEFQPASRARTAEGARKGTAAPAADAQSATELSPTVLETLRSPGQPLDAATRVLMESRLGHDFSRVRIHADAGAAESASAVHALAYTIGRNVVFGEGHYAPGTPAGARLLAHELAHTLQQGEVSGPLRLVEDERLELEAERVAGGVVNGWPTRPVASGPMLQRQAAPETARRKAKPKKLKILQVNLYVDQDVIQLVLEDYKEQPAKLGFNGKPRPGTYQAVRDPQTKRFKLTTPSGAELRRGMAVEWNSEVGTTEGVQEFTLKVIGGSGGAAETTAGAGGGTGAPEPEGRAGAATEGTEGAAADGSRGANAWAEIKKLPEHIRDFLVDERGRRLKPEDAERVLQIGLRLEAEGVTPEELFDYKRRAGAARDVADFERSIGNFLDVRRTKRAARAENVVERERVGTKLYGLEELYQKYRQYKAAERLSRMGPTAAFGQQMARSLLEELNRELPRHDFAGVAEFEQHILVFRAAFQREALAIAFDLLLRYEYLLTREQAKFKDWDNTAAVKLLESLEKVREPAQELYRQQKEAKRAAAAEASTYDYPAAEAKLREAQEASRKAGELVAGAAPEHSMIGWQDFPHERLMRTRKPADVRVLMGRYIAEHIGAIRQARTLLEQKPERVYKLDNLVALARAVQGISDDSIYHLIIRDHAAEIEEKESVRSFLLAILAIGLTVVSFGAGGAFALVAAGAAFGIGAYQAFEEIQKYDEASKFYVAQLLSEEPTVAWAVLAVVGAGLDAAAVVKALKVVVPAARAFNVSPDPEQLKQALGALDERIVRNVDRAARAKRQFEGAVQVLVTGGGKTYAVIAPLVIELYRVTAIAYYALKRGAISFERFLLRLREQELIKEISKLSPEELTTLKRGYQQAIEQSRTGEQVYGKGVYGRLSESARAEFSPEMVDEYAAYARAMGKSEQEIADSIEQSVRSRGQEVAEEFEAAQRGMKQEPGYRRDDPEWAKRVEKLEENVSFGRLNEEYLRRALRGKLAGEYDDVADQVRIRPNNDKGQPADFYFIADHLGRSRKTGGIVAIDGKLSSTSELTNPQAIGYPMLSRNGGTVISRKHPQYPYGMELPPSPALRAEPTVNLSKDPRPPGADIEFKFEPIE